MDKDYGHLGSALMLLIAFTDLLLLTVLAVVG